MNEFLDLKSLSKEEKISGWGRKNIVNSKLVNLKYKRNTNFFEYF